MQELIDALIAERKLYFKQWTFDQPVVISHEHHHQIEKLQKLLSRLIMHFVSEYDKYSHLMPLDKTVTEVLDLYKGKPYKCGTFRTDFIYDESDQMKLLEITCRFAFNGYFQQAIFEQMSKDYLKVQRSNVATEHPYDELFGYLFPSISKYNKLIVLQGEDQKNESKLIAPYLSKIGVELIRVPYQEASTLNANLETSIILSELGFDEILAMEKSVLSRMIRHNFWNDLRTVFLIHDKRFFSVLYNDSFRKDVLSSQEDEFFKSFLLPSYNYAVGSDIWREARDNRSCWIMKSSSLGKSQGVYAGALTSEEEWHQLFASNAKEQMVLQKWVPTTRVSGTIGSQKYHDYLTGTLLFLDDQYFGLGEFRTSSYPITNKVDHRKAFSVTLRETVEPDFQYLKFI